MDPKPLISVIIPNYCHSKYLKQRIDSVLYQTYSNIELIILDDASPDNGASKSIIEDYRSHPKVSHIIYNDVNSNSTFKQWSKGIDLARGEIIWIAESDDYCEYNMLEKLVNEYVRHDDSVIVYTPAVMVDEYGREGKKSLKGKILHNFRKYINVKQHYRGEIFLTHYLAFGCSILNASTAIFSRKAALAIDPVYKTYPAAGDHMFWTLMAEYGSISIINEKLSYCRRHDGTVTSKNDANGLNFKYDKIITDYIHNKYKLSKLRLKLIKIKYLRQIKHVKFENEEIRTTIEQIWSNNEHFSAFSNIIYNIYRMFYVFFKIKL